MTFTREQITYHASNERTDRLAVIGATVGFGNEILGLRQRHKSSCSENRRTGSEKISKRFDKIIKRENFSLLYILDVLRLNYEIDI